MNEYEEIRNYCLNCITKPCKEKGCPLQNDIPTFIHENDIKKAFEKLSSTTVLPAICGRICPHSQQCQGSCVRGIKGEPVSIGKMESMIGDMSLKEGWPIPKEVEERLTSKKVAIIGGGPAGLTCAAFLARNGVQVTIYEKNEQLAGILSYGIPDFRLEPTIVEETINKILALGIEAKTNFELGENIKLEDLISQYNLKDNSQVKLNEHSLVTVRGKKIISKQTPFIVNKSFACEIYLKLILLENNIDFKDLKGINGHKIFKLYSKTNSDFKSNLYHEMRLKNFTNIEDKIENISEAFINWRYIYEKYEKIDSLDFMFLDELCNYLDEKSKELILKNYNYDVNKDIR